MSYVTTVALSDYVYISNLHQFWQNLEGLLLSFSIVWEGILYVFTSLEKSSAPPISWKFEPRPPEDGEAPPHGSHGFIHGMSHQPITAVKKFLLMVWGSWKNPTLGSIKNLAQPHMLQFLNNCKWCPIHTGEKPRACKNVIKNSYKSGNCLYKNTPFINKAWIMILRICISPCFIL